MAVIETKYSIGEVVFYATTETERRKHPCPDCKGSLKWKAVSPAGGEYEFACPRCTAQYQSDLDIALDYTAHTPSVRRLTIGSVQFNSASGHYDSGARYMCRETGVGSGSVYEESRLFRTEDEAMVVAKLMAAEADQSTVWIAKLYDKTLKISDYQLDSAKIQEAKAIDAKRYTLFSNIQYLFSSIEEAEDRDGCLQAVEDYKNFDWESDKAKLSAAA